MTAGDPLLLAALGAPAVQLRVLGTPGPQGSKKATGRMGERVRLVESSKKVKPWRAQVTAAAYAAGHRPGPGGLLAARPAVVARRGRT